MTAVSYLRPEKAKMKVHIIYEMRLSEVALVSRKKPAPERIWIAIGEIPLVDQDDDLDEFVLEPIYEFNPETGKKELSKRYFMGVFSADHMLNVQQSHELIKLMDFLEGGDEGLDFVKNMHDIFIQLGHEVILIETV